MLQQARDPATPRFLRATAAGLALMAYMVALAALVAHRVPGRDEADGWLAARDLSLPQLFQFTRHVGNPALWYLILMPAAKGGAPYVSMLWIQFAIAVLAATVFVWRAPFPLLTRILFIFSYYLAYQYAAIARNYALLALLLFLTAWLYPRRWERPLVFGACLFLLFSTTTHGAFFGAVIVAAMAAEVLGQRRFDRRASLALGMGCAGALFAAVQLWPPADGQIRSFLVPMYPQFVSETLARAIVVPFGSKLIEPLFLLFNLAVLGAAMMYLLRRPLVLGMMVGGFLCLFYIFVFKWCIPSRHGGLLLLWLVFILWIARDQRDLGTRMFGSGWLTRLAEWMNRDRLVRVLNVALFASCLAGLVAWDQAMRINFSDARVAADQIVAHQWDRQPIASTYVAESVLPYLRCRQFWNVQTRQFLSHNTWDQRFARDAGIRDEEIWRRIHEAARRWPDLEVLWNWPLPYPKSNGYQLIFKTQGPVLDSGECFYFYRPLGAPIQSRARASGRGTPSRQTAQSPSERAPRPG